MKTYIVIYLAGQLLFAMQAPSNMQLADCKANLGLLSQNLTLIMPMPQGVTFDCITNTGRP